MIDAKAALLLLHVAGLVVGMGPALFLELHMVRLLRRGRAMTVVDVEVIRLAGALVPAGLILLWLSGIGLLAMAWFHAPHLLASPKVAAKLVVIYALSLNGLLIHVWVMPALLAGVGQPLMATMPRWQRRLALTAGAISTTSWLYAFFLGMARELNFGTPSMSFLAVYACLLGIATIAAWCLAVWLAPPHLSAQRISTSGRPILAGLSLGSRPFRTGMRAATCLVVRPPWRGQL